MSSPAVVHTYPLAVRNCGLFAAFGLLLRTLPYALIRFALLLAFAYACILWLVVTIGGSVWLGAHIAPAFGWVWLTVDIKALFHTVAFAICPKCVAKENPDEDPT